MNLDICAAKSAQEIIAKTIEKPSREVENLITKTLGVLQENGVYACLLYLYSCSDRGDNDVGGIIRINIINILEYVNKTPPKDAESKDMLRYFGDEICNDLDVLLITKQLWEQTLIYARYGAKARG
jgi:hypothetical protein